MGIRKKLQKLLNQPTEMSIEDVTLILNHFGYELLRIKGSHFQFKKGEKLLTIPAHNHKVQKYPQRGEKVYN